MDFLTTHALPELLKHVVLAGMFAVAAAYLWRRHTREAAADTAPMIHVSDEELRAFGRGMRRALWLWLIGGWLGLGMMWEWLVPVVQVTPEETRIVSGWWYRIAFILLAGSLPLTWGWVLTMRAALRAKGMYARSYAAALWKSEVEESKTPARIFLIDAIVAPPRPWTLSCIVPGALSLFLLLGMAGGVYYMLFTSDIRIRKNEIELHSRVWPVARSVIRRTDIVSLEYRANAHEDGWVAHLRDGGEAGVSGIPVSATAVREALAAHGYPGQSPSHEIDLSPASWHQTIFSWLRRGFERGSQP